MKFFFEGQFDPSPRENGHLARISIYPDTNSSSQDPVFVLVSDLITEPISGKHYNVGLVGEKKTPMIFPSTDSHCEQILVMGNIPQPGHRKDGFIDHEKSTATLLNISSGGGAWGSGSCFLALLNPGEMVVSNTLMVWKNENGDLKFKSYNTLAEYLIENDESVDIQFL